MPVAPGSGDARRMCAGSVPGAGHIPPNRGGSATVGGLHLRFRLVCAVLVLAASLAVPLAFASQPSWGVESAQARMPVGPTESHGPDDSSTSNLPAQANPQASAPAPAIPEQTGAVSGTVTDSNGDLVSGATVTIDGSDDHATATADDNGTFNFSGLKPGADYRVTVTAKGFQPWTSPALAVTAGGFVIVKEIQLRIAAAATSVTVTASSVELATEQVQLEEKQRIFGIIPNFYVVYDSENAAPLTPKLKFQMAFRSLVDPVSFAGAVVMGAIDQAADIPSYREGWRGYGERVGSVYADGFTDTMLGGAILPTILRQDPRYYYKGKGSIRSRALYAMAAPFVCKGDNGRWQPNYSSVGGDLISASISTAYYPSSDRGAGLLFENLLIETAERSASTLIQEFLLRKWTPSANGRP